MNRRVFFISASAMLAGRKMLTAQHDVISNLVKSNTEVQSHQLHQHRPLLAIVGDTQRTSSLEHIFLGREQNDVERVLIANAIAEYMPRHILHLGDLVCYGEEQKDWAYYDSVMKPIQATGALLYATPGNHDYGLVRRSTSFLKRMIKHSNNPIQTFPALVVVENIACIILDSNFDMLSTQEIASQHRRYEELISAAESNTAIEHILVTAHNPPYSNSDLGGNTKVQQTFVPLFEQSRKAKLFLSGHVHSYERFLLRDKHYVVSGGGGGPRRTIRTDVGRPFHSDMYRDGEMRAFHFIVLQKQEAGIIAQVMMLNQQSRTFHVGDSFSLT